MLFAILLLLPASLIISLVATTLVKNLAPRFNFVDKPGHRKIHEHAMPLGGGIAILIAVALPMLIGLAVVTFSEPPRTSVFVSSTVADGLARHWAGVRHHTPLALKLLSAMLLIHILGLWDDRKALGPYFKLAAQLLIIAMLVIWADLRALTALDSLGMGKWPSILLTILWIAGITNAFNFLDNMDGLSAGVAAVCGMAFLATTISMPEPQWFVAAMLALLIGALLGFLCFNFAPASIFMGDSGSLLIGLLMGVLTVRTTYLQRPIAQGWYEVLAPLIVLAVPVYDMAVVSVIRISRGKSPFVGDKNHLSHRLVERGMSRRTAVLCIYLITAATSAAAIALVHVESSFAAGMIFLQTLLILSAVFLLERHPLPRTEGEK